MWGSTILHLFTCFTAFTTSTGKASASAVLGAVTLLYTITRAGKWDINKAVIGVSTGSYRCVGGPISASSYKEALDHLGFHLAATIMSTQICLVVQTAPHEMVSLPSMK
jgi:hypothetical protein